MNDPIIRNPLALNEDALGENFEERPNPHIHCSECGMPFDFGALNQLRKDSRY